MWEVYIGGQSVSSHRTIKEARAEAKRRIASDHDLMEYLRESGECIELRTVVWSPDDTPNQPREVKLRE